MGHYVVCDNKCLQEAYNKDETEMVITGEVASQNARCSFRYMERDAFVVVEDTLKTFSQAIVSNLMMKLPDECKIGNWCVISYSANAAVYDHYGDLSSNNNPIIVSCRHDKTSNGVTFSVQATGGEKLQTSSYTARVVLMRLPE